MKHGPAIMVVDDDASLLATLKEFLSHEGYDVETAQSGAEALAIQAANPRLSLALIDLIMPLMGGLDLTAELRRRDPDLAIVIMTGYGTIETAVDAIKRGAEDYVTKPFDYEAIRKKVARLMEVIELRERVDQLGRRPTTTIRRSTGFFRAAPWRARRSMPSRPGGCSRARRRRRS